MRESTYSSPHVNRAVLTVQTYMYDRRALDSNSPIALLCSLTSLTHLTSTSPRIREVLTSDGGLERLLDILREASESHISNPAPDLWGLNGPSTARLISWDRQIGLRHSLAFQSIVNIGVRGSEAVRTRVVQSGALDMVAQILEMYLINNGVVVQPSTLGSRNAVANAARLKQQGVDPLRRPRHTTRHAAPDGVEHPAEDPNPADTTGSAATTRLAPTSSLSNPAGSTSNRRRPVPQPDTDVEMADTEQDGADDAVSAAGDNAMDVDAESTPLQQALAAAAAATPRASSSGLPSHPPPMPIDVPERPVSTDDLSGPSSANNSFSEGNDSRAVSDQEAAPVPRQHHRPPPLNLAVQRLPGLAQGDLSNQSSPMGTPTRMEAEDTIRPGVGRRGTIVARPITLAPPTIRAMNQNDAAGSGASDAGDDIDMNAATINAGLAAALREGGNVIETQEPINPPNVEIVDMRDGFTAEEPDAEALAAEQARLDMEAGAPPGQPGNPNTTPPVAATTAADNTPGAPTAATAGAVPNPAAAGATPGETIVNGQVIIANGAPRGFHDLGSYVGISSIINPENDRFSEDSVLLSLQLLAYLSKYPHVRNAFHNPRRPMHATFDFGPPELADALPKRPTISRSTNIFSLVERYTFRPSAADPEMFVIPRNVQYWAGVIMRNACRKDEQHGGVRQCAYMSCGRWETYAREFAKCRRCRKAKYCSKECQSKAWAEGHRFWCNVRSDDNAEGGNGPAQSAHDILKTQLGDDLSDTDPIVDMMPRSDVPRDVVARFVQIAQRILSDSPADSPMASVRDGISRQATPDGVPMLMAFTAIWVHTMLQTILAGQPQHERPLFFEVARERFDVVRDWLVNSFNPPPGPGQTQPEEAEAGRPGQRARRTAAAAWAIAHLHQQLQQGTPFQPQLLRPQTPVERHWAGLTAPEREAQLRNALQAEARQRRAARAAANLTDMPLPPQNPIGLTTAPAPHAPSAPPPQAQPPHPHAHRQASAPFSQPIGPSQPTAATANAATDAANLAATARPIAPPHERQASTDTAPARSGPARGFLTSLMRMGGRNIEPSFPAPDGR